MKQYTNMMGFINQPGTEALLQALINESKAKRTEIGFSVNSLAGFYFPSGKQYLGAVSGGIAISKHTAFTVHTHYMHGWLRTGGQSFLMLDIPSPTDVKSNIRGMVVNEHNVIWGYGP